MLEDSDIQRIATALAPHEGLLTLSETADLLRVCSKTVTNYVKQGMPAKKLGREWRFERRAVMAWLDRAVR